MSRTQQISRALANVQAMLTATTAEQQWAEELVAKYKPSLRVLKKQIAAQRMTLRAALAHVQRTLEQEQVPARLVSAVIERTERALS